MTAYEHLWHDLFKLNNVMFMYVEVPTWSFLVAQHSSTIYIHQRSTYTYQTRHSKISIVAGPFINMFVRWLCHFYLARKPRCQKSVHYLPPFDHNIRREVYRPYTNVPPCLSVSLISFGARFWIPMLAAVLL